MSQWLALDIWANQGLLENPAGRMETAVTTTDPTACPECYATGQLPIMQCPDPTHTRKVAPVLCPKCGGTGPARGCRI